MLNTSNYKVEWRNIVKSTIGVEKLETYAVFRLERSTEVLELTYLGKYFARVNAN